MKKLFVQILLLNVLFSFCNSQLQGQSALETAKAVLSDEFDNAQEFDWEEEEGEFIATSFTEEGYIEVIFNPDGTWQQTSQNLEYQSLPEGIKSAVKKLYPKTPKYFDTVIHFQSAEIQKFIVGFETETETITLTFDENAKLLNKNVEEIEDGF